jgi:membrane fusion protein (multidrug efflux system)
MSDQVLELPSVLVPRDVAAVPVRKVSRITRKRVAMAGAALLLAVGAGWFGEHWWTVGRFIESTDDAYVGGDVTVLAPKVAGFIAQVAVTDNQRVRAGDLLVRIDDRDFRAALQKADAAVAGAQATLVNLAAMRREQIALVAEEQAELASAQAEVGRAGYDVDRYRALSEVQFASVQRFQQADADNRKARAAAAKSAAAVDAATRQIEVIDSQRQEAEAALAGAIADRETARLNLSYTELRAPIDGTVGNRSARAGAYATVGAELLSLVPAHGLWVDANFKENQLAHMRPGSPASVEVDTLPGVPFHGHVASLAPATGAVFSVLPPENATGNFTKIVQRVPVRILLDGDTVGIDQLRPGLSVTADVDLRPRTVTQVAAVP